jgi:hypothetical protein
MPSQRLRDILDSIARVDIAVCGDFCLDAYWMLSPRGGEVSAETGLRAQAAGRHYYSLGGAANVVANVAALEPTNIRRYRVIGDDIFAGDLRQLRGLGVTPQDDRPGRRVRHRDGYQALRRNERSRGDLGSSTRRGDTESGALAPGAGDRAVRRGHLQPAGARRPQREAFIAALTRCSRRIRTGSCV